MSDGVDVPRFFRGLVTMITDVIQDEWGTPKAPLPKLKNRTRSAYIQIQSVIFQRCLHRVLSTNYLQR